MAFAAKTHWIKTSSAVVVAKDVTNNLTYTYPTVAFYHEVVEGNDVIKLLDGASAASNVAQGTATGRFRIVMGLIPGTTTAAWFNNSFALEENDNSAGYWTYTVYRHPNDAAPYVFSFSKHDTFGLTASFGLDGRAELVRVEITGWSADPLDGTALTLPSLGPLGKLLTYGTAAHTNATQVRSVQIALTRNCEAIPEVNNTGTNANLPYLCGGFKQGVMEGGVVLAQSGIAVTVPGINNAEAAYTVAFGAAAAGISFAMTMEFSRNAGSTDGGFSMQQNSYKLVSSDGTNAGMIVAADL